MGQRAKLFKNGRSQAVRLPAAVRFDCDEVFIRRDAETGDVILSARPTSWDAFLETLEGLEVPEDFLSPDERNQPPATRDPFAGWEE